ncbi:hypothetical protein FNF31_06817 [Cafeteria roenbergensis]|uniref:VASt domain-containing protein n=2 Tax=Cafeteria roenbergensis TaxID=33653 RepID=A0A5A8CEC0_CAFRO|nr:hypothetical protein FNF31_06817 [Cafeteria roenbergensis]
MASAGAASRTSAASPARSASRSDVESEGTGTGPEPSLKECARGFPKTASDTARALVHSLFKLPPADVLFSDFACALEEMPAGGAANPAPRASLYGRLYVTSSAICFFADAASWEGVAVRKVLPFKYVDRLHQHRVAWMLPAMLLSVSAKGIRRSYLLRGFFGSGRDEALSLCKVLLQHWQPDRFREITTPESAAGGPAAVVAGPPSSINATAAAEAGFDSLELEEGAAAGALVGSAASGGGRAGRPRAGTETAAAVDPEALAEVVAALGSGRSLADATLPCTVSGFWRELLSDDAGFGALDANRAQGNTEVSVGQWEEREGAAGATPRAPGRRPRPSLAQQAGDGAGSQDEVPHLQAHPRLVRAVRFRKKVSGVAFVPSTRVEQRHSLWRLAGEEGHLRLVLVIATRSLDVPYGDTFVIVETWLVEPAAGEAGGGGGGGQAGGGEAEAPSRCRLRIAARVQFESRGILSGQIESMSIAGMAPTVQAWLERARAHVAAAASRAGAHGRGALDAAAQRRAGPAAVRDLFTEEQLQLATATDEQGGGAARWAGLAWLSLAGDSAAHPPVAPEALGEASGSDLLRDYGRLYREGAATRRAARLWSALAVSLAFAALAFAALVAGGWAPVAAGDPAAAAALPAPLACDAPEPGESGEAPGAGGDGFLANSSGAGDDAPSSSPGAAAARRHARLLSQVLDEMRSIRAQRDAAAPAWLTIAAVIAIVLVAASLVPARIVLDALGWPQPA